MENQISDTGLALWFLSLKSETQALGEMMVMQMHALGIPVGAALRILYYAHEERIDADTLYTRIVNAAEVHARGVRG